MSNSIALGILILRSTVLLLLMTGHVTQGKALASADNDEDGSDVGVGKNGNEGMKSFGGRSGEKSSDDGNNLILHNYMDDPSSVEQIEKSSGNDGWHSRSPIPQGNMPYWNFPSSPFSQRNNEMILTYPSKRFDSSGATGTGLVESGGGFLTLPPRAQLSPNSVTSMEHSHLLNSPAAHSAISSALRGYRMRPISYNLRGYSATGNGRLSGFLPPISPRKRQILFRQCFFNPISCF